MRKETHHRPDAEVVVTIYERRCAADTHTIDLTARRFAPAAPDESLARVHCMKLYDTYKFGTNPYKHPPIQSEYDFYMDGKDDAFVCSANLSAALAIKPKRSLAASRLPQNGARLPATAATGAASYLESQQCAFAALMGQAVPATNGNKADQPAASTPQRAGQRKPQAEAHAKSATAAPTPSPSVLLEGHNTAKSSAQTESNGSRKHAAAVKSARGAVLSSSLVAPCVEQPGAAGSSGALSAPAGRSAGKPHGSKAAAGRNTGIPPGPAAAAGRNTGSPPGPSAAAAGRSTSIPPGPSAAAASRNTSIPPGPAAAAAGRNSSIPPGPSAAAAGRNNGIPPGPSAATASSSHCSAGGTSSSGRPNSAAEPTATGRQGDVQQAPGRLQGMSRMAPVIDDGGPEYTAKSAIRAAYAYLKAFRAAEAAEKAAEAATHAQAAAEAAAKAQSQEGHTAGTGGTGSMARGQKQQQEQQQGRKRRASRSPAAGAL